MLYRHTPITIACLSALLHAGAAHAQSLPADTPAAPSDTTRPAGNDADGAAPAKLETVTVTAQRRSEVLSKTPVAITAVSQKALDSQGISSAVDIATLVPNMQVAQNGFSMRGIGNNNSFGGYSTVAVQVDGIYEPNYSALSLGLYDVDRIEALRGPQGTVYGRNATAGVVNIETAKPRRKFQAFGDLAFGNYGDRTERAVVNLPVNEMLQVRASVMHRKNDGYDDGGASTRRYGAIDVSSARLAWALQATPDLQWNASVSTAKNTGTVPLSTPVSYTYFPNASLSAGTFGAPVTVSPAGNILGYRTARDIRSDMKEDALRSSLVWSIDDRWSLTYLAGIGRFEDSGIDSSTGLFSLQQRGTRTSNYSHEIDVNYEAGRFKVVAGLYAYRDRQSGLQKVSIGNALPYPFNSVLPPGFAFAPGSGFEPSGYGGIDVQKRINADRNRSTAAFAQGTYNLADDWRLTTGVRNTRDKFSTDGDSQACAYGSAAAPDAGLRCGVPFGPPSGAVASSGSTKTSWRLSTDYDLTPDQMLFATVATGYRGGGATANVAPRFITYQPETLTNYELGWRSRLLANTLSLNVTAFNMDYKNLQVSGIGQDLLGNNTPVTVNAATARIRGLEFEGDWLVTRNDRLQGYLTYLDARFGTFANAVNNSTGIDLGTYNAFAAVAGLPALSTSSADYSGKRLPGAPRLALRGNYAHTFTLADGTRLVPSIQVYWQAKSYTSFDNYDDPARGGRGAYTKTDLNLNYESPDHRWTAAAYVYNLGNKSVYASATAQPAMTYATYMAPRTYGLRVGYRFD